MTPKLMTVAIRNKLIANHEASLAGRMKDGSTPDHKPAPKVFNPTGAATWLFTEYDPETRTFFGLCDLGFGQPELGYVDERELLAVRGRFGLPLERDAHFTAKHTISAYAAAAREKGRIAA